MQSKLIDQVVTLEDQHQLLEELGWLEESLYKTDKGGWEETLKTRLRMSVAGIIEREIVNAGNNKKEYLREIMSAVKGMKIMKITIAIPTTDKLVKKVSNYVKSAWGAGIIIKLELDKSILGGACVAFEGKYYNGSLNRIWESTWKEKGEEFLKKYDFR